MQRDTEEIADETIFTFEETLRVLRGCEGIVGRGRGEKSRYSAGARGRRTVAMNRVLVLCLVAGVWAEEKGKRGLYDLGDPGLNGPYHQYGGYLQEHVPTVTLTK